MTSPYVPDADPAAAVAILRARHVGVPIWFGNHTRRYWAVLGGQLVEASNATKLGRVLDSARPAAARVEGSLYGRGF